MNILQLSLSVCLAAGQPGVFSTEVPAANRPTQDSREIPPAVGPFVNLTDEDVKQVGSFRRDDRIVMTYYFYWYDYPTKAHIINGDGTDALTTHPASFDDFSFRSVRWHKSQLLEMMAAGIDVVLPVYWGAPSDHKPGSHHYWSIEGLTPLVQAADELRAEGKEPPRIGLFYDTTTLQSNAWHIQLDLTTDLGKRWFFATIRDFYSLIPPRHWAAIDGQPIVSLYSAAFAKNHDQSCIDFVRDQFSKQFGRRVPFVIREVSWRVQADSDYAWGGAIRPRMHGVAQIGPGYDHSNVPGRTPLKVSRRDGKTYENAWLSVLRRSPKLVAIETWNEFHEGTDIAESREYGRKYIELTRKYVDLFKQGQLPPGTPDPAVPKLVEVSLETENREQGLTQIDHDDGRTAPAQIGGRECRVTQSNRSNVRYVYFVIDDSFKWTTSMDVVVEVEYFDRGVGNFTLQFDAHDVTAPVGGAYKPSGDVVSLKGTNQWKTARFTLRRARFANSQNSGADFRIAATAAELNVQRVSVRRLAEEEPK